MASFQDKLKNAPNPQRPVPPHSQLLLFFLLLGWLVTAPILVGILTLYFPVDRPPLAGNLLAAALLVVLLLLPAAGLLVLAHRQPWPNLKPFALALLAALFYVAVAVAIRAISEPGGNRETVLRLTALTTAALIIGGAALLRSGVPNWMLPHAFGFDRPPLAGVLAAIALIAIVTIGWPLTGALGDSWTAQLILLQALARALPEEILFRGAVLGVITFNFQHRKALAALMAILIYAAFTPTMLVPHNSWAKLLLLITGVPFALLMIELRALTGNIWAGTLVAWGYHAAPLLFADPRDELPIITQPWQTAAHLWMILATGILAIALWLGRQYFVPRWRWSGRATAGWALGVALLLWSLWAGLWVGLGRPGFYNDGFLIIMQQQANLNGAETIADPLTRREFVRNRLIETAQKTQAPVREALDAAGLSYKPFYLINMVRVDGHHRRMADFADLPGVARVMRNPNVRRYPLNVPPLGYGPTSEEGRGVGWNIDQVRADEVWQMGVTGQGIVVGGQDTGYDWTHPALRSAYRGSTGGTVDHTYNWHDAWNESTTPFDDDAHGTHTMGTVVGNDGNGNQIGVAPGARWIGCRNMRRGLGNPASYTECMEFFLAPYPAGGDPFTDGDVSKAPHVVNNSWGCPDIEGCDDTVLQPALTALRAAGLMMVVSAGNDGPNCQTVNEPPARYNSAFVVGATDSAGQIAGFSSRGPVPDNSSPLKPDVAAPGAAVRSSLPGGGYGTADGTSMAGPHVAGLVALLWSANPNLIGEIEATEEIIRRSARPVAVSAACPVDLQTPGDGSLVDQLGALNAPPPCACGGVTGVPNNVYGWGEIDALEAVKLAMGWEK